jgi:serine/threonine-protein kinase
MGSVWLAEHMGLDVPCALKFIQAESQDSTDVRRRFEREAKIAAQIRSPHVVQILDHGVWEQTPYIAMEYLDGEDLERRLQRVRRLSTMETATIVAQVSRALSKAHAAGLVHRDLKPANIFLARDDDREIVKVLDFGIAKDVTLNVNSTTKTGSLLGTPAYMSPEQAQGVRGIDHRSDLWSLAVVVYECVTGDLPFDSEAFGDLLLKIMVHPLPVPSMIARVPPAFDAWWARAAARDPDARYQTAKEMADALVLALEVTSSSGIDLRTSISDTFSLSRLDLSSSPSLRAAVLALREGRSSYPGAPDPQIRLREETPSEPLIAQAITLAAPQAAEAGASTSTPVRAPEALAAEAAAPAGRPRHLTAGPVSTSLTPKPIPARGLGRVIAAMLAGIAVTGIGAFLLLRNVGVSETAADPQAPAADPSALPEVTDPSVPSGTPVVEPAVTGTPPTDGTAVVQQPAPTGTGSAAASGAGTVAPAVTPPRPPGTGGSNKKIRDPRDFGI